MPRLHAMIFNVSLYPHASRPVGGHRIAHILRDQDWDVEVVDWANWWTLDQLKQLALARMSDDTKFVGFSHLFSIWSPLLESFGIWIKQTFPHVRLISGSPVYPTFKSQCLDYYVKGWGEYAIEVLLKYIVGNGPCPKFDLLSPNGIKVIDAVNSYPAYPMGSLMVTYEDRDFIHSDEWLAIETSRGCVFSCAFCNFPVLGVKGDYTRDADDFERQIKDAYDRFGVSNYVIVDETFNDKQDKIKKFADVIETLAFQTWFTAYIRADLLIARPQDRIELLRMNVLGHYYGIESFHTDSAKSVGKGMSGNRIKEGLSQVRQYFESNGRGLYRGTIGLLAGLPHETIQSLDETYTWLVENWQKQSFSIQYLMIPDSDSNVKPSKISQDLAKYGYEEMSGKDIKQYQPESSDYDIERLALSRNYKEVIWKNKNMNWFDAKSWCDNTVIDKKQHDFRPNCHYISHQLNKVLTVQERLDMSYEAFDGEIKSDISDYIAKKLNHCQ